MYSDGRWAENETETSEVETEDNLPTENCEVDETEKEEDFETVKAERDSLKQECEVLKEKVEKYEEQEKSLQVESIISGVRSVFDDNEISELREEAKKYSLDELNIFSNEVKAKAFDKMESGKNFEVKENKITRMAVNDVLVNEQSTSSKYTWK